MTNPENNDSLLAMVDARCMCRRCEDRTTNVYRMVGYCLNCKTEPILIIYRAGDKASDCDCPVCGVWHSVRARRMATADEIPAAVSA
jgi:hypothetical protein